MNIADAMIGSFFLLILAVSVGQSIPDSALNLTTNSPHHISHQTTIADTAEVPDEHISESSEQDFLHAQ